MGARIVCRDQEGDILFSACMTQSSAMIASQAEAVALWKTMKLCDDLQVGEAELEGDALCIVKAVNSKDESWEWGGQIIKDIRGMLNNRPQWYVNHIRREANKAANYLAKIALIIDEDLVWMEDGLESLYSLILQDKIVIRSS
ncbi:uncharacterized protein LOC121236576 [Juglans microcarpa x Juglans regia]|uniref:uncharacterized protein LOC121236576 n=1 Tax=Juglans microcarpa x Juglans regia TaxID=2249226 RepID=UPI001B7EED4C|nr:uncharacterized protein LOC121236576 [Juglans microcarpa x Juglans regia]